MTTDTMPAKVLISILSVQSVHVTPLLSCLVKCCFELTQKGFAEGVVRICIVKDELRIVSEIKLLL